MVLSSYFSIFESFTSGNSRNFSILPKDIRVSTNTSKVLGKFLKRPLKLVKIPKLVKTSSILNSSFKY